MDEPNNATSGAVELHFWFEFASTYSYIAMMQIEALCAGAGVPLVWRPFLLGPIFALQGWGDSHFNLNARRGAYMWRDMERLTAKLGLPWRRPAVFPRSTSAAARIACALLGEPCCGDFIRRVYIANFAQDRDIGDPVVLRSLLEDSGADAVAVAERAEIPKNRALLRANTEEAIALGIFGSPNCVVGRELFWGEEALLDAIDWARAARPGRA